MAEDFKAPKLIYFEALFADGTSSGGVSSDFEKATAWINAMRINPQVVEISSRECGPKQLLWEKENR